MNVPQQVALDDRLLAYILAHSEPLPAGLDTAVSRAEGIGRSSMQIAADQALLIRMLVRLARAKAVLEIGTFLGFSASIFADAVGSEGGVVCLDHNGEWAGFAEEMWSDLGLRDRIDLRLGDAHETIGKMGSEEVFDLVFIDADKTGYVYYLDEVSPHLRSGGLLLVDNTLWSGRVADETVSDESTTALREFNRLIAADDRYDVTMVAVGDGLTVAIRR